MWLFPNILTVAENIFLKCFQNDGFLLSEAFHKCLCIYLCTIQVGVLLLIPFKRSFLGVLLVI